jgi:penicillin-binding protein 1A
LAQLALGGLTDGVSTYEMAAAYSAFARGGTYIEPRTYSLVLDNNGETLLSRDNTASTAVSARTSYYITDMLKKVVSSGTGTAANFSGQEIAGKTGTTTSRKDLWFVGYTPYYTAAVWTGYDQQERLDSSLKNPSTTLWRQVMEKVHSTLPYKDFDQPEGGLKTVTYCATSGKLPTSYCSGHLTTGTFYPGDEPTEYCTIHRASVSHSYTGSSGTTGGSGTTNTTTGTENTTTEPTGTENTGGDTTTGTDASAGGDTGGGEAGTE